MTGNEIREMFLKFFEERGHRRVRSSSLVPHGDPTLLFTNAGMNQFKDVFLGLEQRDYKRAVSVQKCVRAGGKHNDLEKVGFTNRHHTFFEMLGNFSFGDYFKGAAIKMAWELITSPQYFGIPKDKLYVTIFKGEAGVPPDVEAYGHWLAEGVPKDRIFEFGSKDNFWAMGDTGPCGPCSEIHYDMGPAASDLGHVGDRECKLGCDCGRYVEIWNLVFMQFLRDASGALKPLPKPSIDTGAGLERLAAVLQDKISNFDTDLFVPLMKRAAELAGVEYKPDAAIRVIDRIRYATADFQPSLRIIADHSRAATFLISDGVIPSNEGRGYVLRKIIRRALLHVRFLNGNMPFLSQVAAVVRAEMKDAYPELTQNADRVNTVLEEEERRFMRTVNVGLKKLYEQTKPLRKPLQKYSQSKTPFPGDKAFQLYDTFGLPVDFMRDVLRDEGFKLDEAGFERAMEEQRKRARASWKGAQKEAAPRQYQLLAQAFQTKPDFYFGIIARDCRIEAIIKAGVNVPEIIPGETAEVVLDRTAFYAEAGGQVADVGWLYDNAEALQVAEVRGAYYPVTGLIAHRVIAKEDLRVGDRVATVADGARREHIKRNHTATHLMHAALRNILGTHVKQSGSLVAPDHLRFDFTHFTSVDADELREIEQQVNEEILRNLELQTDVTSLDEALASGALAFFGDKYPEQNVRVVTIPDPAAELGFYSKELCGGTHVRRTGDIGVFKIVAEQSVAAGVRRVEAIAGARAFADYQRALATLRQLAATLNVGEDALPAAVERLTLATKQMEKQLEALRRKGALSQVGDLLEHVRKVKGVQVLAADVKETDREALRQLVDTLRQKLGSGVVVLGSTENGKVAIIGGVTKDLTSRLHAGKIVQEVAREVGGSGGGRPDLGEAGGKDTSALKKAIGGVYQIVEQML